MYNNRTLGDMMQEIIAVAAAMVEAKKKGMKRSIYQDWVDMTNHIIITTENTIEREIHMGVIIKEGHTRGGWSSLLLAIKAEVESGVEDVDDLNKNTIVA